jgi:hypothetical protein
MLYPAEISEQRSQESAVVLSVESAKWMSVQLELVEKIINIVGHPEVLLGGPFHSLAQNGL